MSGRNSDDTDDIPDSHNYTEPISARLSPETKGRFDDYADRHTIGTAEAVRRLIRTGLDESDNDGTKITDQVITAGATAIVLGYPVLAATNGGTRLAVGYVGFVTLFALLEPWLSKAWNRAKNALPSLPFS